MAFDTLSGKLKNAMKKLTGKGLLTEANIKDAMRDVRLALLEADVNFKVAKQFVAKATERAVGSDVLKSLTPGQQVIKIVHEELGELMGGKNEKLLVSSKPPTVILLCGLQGAGKTTFAGKLAMMLKKQGKTPMLVACDIYRPAAIDQLKIVGGQAGVKVYADTQSKDAVAIAQAGLEAADDAMCDTVIIDTAGRLHIDDEMMDEIKKIAQATGPIEKLLVVDAMTGQDAVNIATSFNEALDITGVVLSKLDGDARGGAALSIKTVTGKPIKFSSTGEKLENIEPFHPDRMASRILGMGDMMTLIEKAQESFDQEHAEKMEKKLRKMDFTLEDFLDQFESIQKMGGADEIAALVPGMKMQDVDADMNDVRVRRLKAIIQSMTHEERVRPEIINASRKRRIAQGSGSNVSDVNRMLNQFAATKKMLKQMTGFGKKQGKKSRRKGRGGMPLMFR